jgi:TonB-linked SusC/RagA family outer membrane protein
MEMADSAYVHSGLAPLYSQAQIDLYRNATDRNRYPNNNWLKDVFRTATVQNYYLNMTGGQSGTTYSLGLGYTGQPGTMIGFTYHKYTLDLGLTSAVSKRITFGTNIQARYGDYIAPEDGSGDFYLSTLAQSPLYKPRFDNGSWIASAYSNESHNKNPVAIANNSTTLQPDYYAQGNLSLDILLLDGLKWENKAGLTFETQKYNTFAPSVPVYYYSDSSYAGTLDDGTPGLYVGRSDNIYTTFYSQLNYKRTFGPHTLSVLGGFQQEHNVASNIDAFRTQFATNALRELNAGPTTGQTNDGTSSQWAIQSFYGNLNYDYDDRFLLGASTRYDGTSRLPASSRWGLFYSFSGGWRISREAFLKDVRWLDDLKLRASWGELGNQNIGTYPYQALLSQSSYAFAGNVATGFTATSLTDPSLTWETTRVFDGGVDLTVWNNRLNITGDWYNKYTFDILRGSQVPVWLGLNAPTVNNGAVRNTGWELSAQYKDNVGKSFQYHLGVKLQHNRNRLVSFGTPEINGNTIMKNGQPINSYYLYVVDGVFQNQAEISKSAVQNPAPAPGDLKYADINGDGVIDGNDRKVVSGVYPDLEYSFNAGASWKGFDLNLQLYGSHGAKLYMSGWGAEPFLQGSMPTKDWLDAWTPAHPSATMPRLYVGWSYPQVDNYNSTFFLHNASFLRVKNVVVGYTLPARLSKGFHSLRIYFSGDNLLLFSPIKGVDPERAGGNTLFVNYPQNRTLTVGASVQF